MSFHPKTFLEAKARYRAMKRTPMRSGTRTLKRSRIKPSIKRLGSGRKMKAWDSVRTDLKKRFEKAGIMTCELRASDRVEHECGNDNYLGFAHDAKRRKLTTEDLYRVILICNFAHDIIEVWPAEKMKVIVNETIQSRRVQP